VLEGRHVQKEIRERANNSALRSEGAFTEKVTFVVESHLSRGEKVGI
jgi:hypothetical protein